MLDEADKSGSYVDLRIDELARMVAKGFEQCATKEYLDERLDIMKAKDGEVHKQLKLHSVLIVDELKRKKVIGPKRANTLVSMEPFPQKLS